MKYLLYLSLFAFIFSSCKKKSNSTLFPCDGGISAELYECDNIDLYSVVTPQQLEGLTLEDSPTVRLNDIWGWTDPLTDKEYALVGLTNAVSFVDVTDPEEPIIIGKLNESSVSAKNSILQDPNYEACTIGIGSTEESKAITEGSTWRDFKVYDDHLFIGSDGQAHGIQVFDLTKLRNYDGEFLNFEHDALYSGLLNSHNVVMNEQTGFAYAVGATNAEVCADGGLHILDVNDPKNPTFAGCYDDTTPPRRRSNSAYIHDAQCVIYDGPDSDYTGKEICFNAAERSFVIADATDKENILTLGFATDPNMSYAHQGWLTEDHQYFLMNDELDEYNIGRTTKTYIFDVRDLDNPVFVDFYEHDTQSIDHNLYVKGDYVFASNYVSGLRILKINDIGSADLSLVGFFDSEPRTFDSPNQLFLGAWSNYPYFESGNIIVSDISRGLFIVKPDLD